jgi:serine/threonine-protein kinase
LAPARKTVELYQHAIDLDPGFAAAWGGLSQAYVWLYMGFDPSEENKTKAKAAVDKALDLAPNLPETHMALGYYYYYGESDFARAITQFEAARELSPNDASIIMSIGLVKRRQGLWDDSLKSMQQARELDPGSSIVLFDIAISLTFLRRYAEAEHDLKRAAELDSESKFYWGDLVNLYVLWDGDAGRARAAAEKAAADPEWYLSWPTASAQVRLMPDFFTGLLESKLPNNPVESDPASIHIGLAGAFAQLGDNESALAHYDSAISIIESNRPPNSQANAFGGYFGVAYAATGKKKEALEYVDESLRLMPLSKDALLGTYTALTAAEVYIRVGEFEAAIDQLEILMSVPAELSRALLRGDPLYDPLRDHPRFKKLAEGNP